VDRRVNVSNGRKYAKSGDMLPIMSAASGRREFFSGRTAAACEMVNGMRGIVTIAPAPDGDQLWHPGSQRLLALRIEKQARLVL
jgi:hypothetical protein